MSRQLEPPPPDLAPQEKDPLRTFLGIMSPEAMEEALVEVGFSAKELHQHVVNLIRDPDPKVKAKGISLFEQMHERRLRHAGHSREITINLSPDGIVKGGTVRGTVLSNLPSAPPVPGMISHRPGDPTTIPEEPHDPIPEHTSDPQWDGQEPDCAQDDEEPEVEHDAHGGGDAPDSGVGLRDA